MLVDYIEGILRILKLATITILIVSVSILVVWGFYEIIQYDYFKQLFGTIAIGAGVIFLIAFIKIVRDLKR